MAMDLPHIRIHPQCGACEMSFQVGSKIIALTYKRGICITLDAGLYPGSEYCEQKPGSYIFCRFTQCRGCRITSESITCHTDCFNLVKGLSDGTLQRLWVAATWRYPWPHSSPLLLPSEDPIEDYIQLASNICDLPLLNKLPNEIKTTIIQHCGPDLFWRYASSIKLIKELESAQNSTDSTILLPLIEIESWYRGSEPILSKDDNNRGIIRLTIDARGLREICRFSSPPKPEALSTHSSYFLYIFKQAIQLSHTKVQFKIGLGRLIIPVTTSLQLWDCPAPPPWSMIQSRQLIKKPHIKRFTTINLKQYHGLTFFISSRGISSIHLYTLRSPDTMKTFTALIP